MGKQLSEKTTRQVILVVLAMLFSVPLFTATTYITEPNSFDYGLSLIYELGPYTKAGHDVFNDTVRIQKDLIETPLVRLFVRHNMTILEDLKGGFVPKTINSSNGTQLL